MKRRLFKILRIFSVGLVVLVTLAALLLTEEFYRGKWAWEKYKREAEARGVPFDPRPFIPPPVPDDQNFAMTPLLKPLFGEDENYKTALNKRLELTSPKAGVTKPGLGRTWGQCVDIGKWRKYLGEPDLLQALRKFEPELDEVSAAIRRPFARFPVRYEDGISVKLPQTEPLKNLSALYALRALAALDAGQSDRAFSDVESIFGLGECIGNEPLLISQLVRVSLLLKGSQVVWEGLRAHRWSESQLTALQIHLERIDLLAGALRAVRFEHVIFPEAMCKILNDPKEFASIWMAGDAPSLRRFGLECWCISLKATHYRSMPTACHFDEEYLLSVIDPVKGEINIRNIKEGEQQAVDQRESLSFSAQLIDLGSSTVISTFPKFAFAHTVIDQAVIACALERYRLAHNEYPDKLDALVPQYLTKLPHDIINGQPLHYRRTDDGLFVLYSVGWNETDDNGTVGKDKLDRQDFKQGDWVWRYPAPTTK